MSMRERIERMNICPRKTCKAAGYSPCVDRNGRQRKYWHAKRQVSIEDVVNQFTEYVNEEIYDVRR